jgi:hypothetical protein
MTISRPDKDIAKVTSLFDHSRLVYFKKIKDPEKKGICIQFSICAKGQFLKGEAYYAILFSLPLVQISTNRPTAKKRVDFTKIYIYIHFCNIKLQL